MIGEALVTWLKADANVVAIVADRIFPMEIPQGQALPAITFQEIDAVPRPHMGGESGLTLSRFQIDCWSRSQSEAYDAAERVRISISGYDGPMGDYPRVAILFLDRRMLSRTPEAARAGAIYGVSADYQLAHDTTVPVH